VRPEENEAALLAIYNVFGRQQYESLKDAKKEELFDVVL